MAPAIPKLPLDMDIQDPNFARDMALWSWQTQRDMGELVAATKRTIATTRTLIAEADRLLPLK